MTMSIRTAAALSIAAGTAVAVATGCILAFGIATPAGATVQFAKETGKSCGACHTNPQGAGPLTPFGEKFKANGNKLP
jgi:mono/diheme cytochrome c family protein